MAETPKAIGLANIASWLNNKDNKVGIGGHLNRYFQPKAKKADVFQGQHFEWYLRKSDPDCFTAVDVLALASLGVNLPAQTAREIIEDESKDFRSHIAEVRELIKGNVGVDTLWRAPEDWFTNEKSALTRLYRRLDEVDQIGSVSASKLMATKFPRLIPIRDSRVEQLLELKSKDNWWLIARNLLCESNYQLVKMLKELRGEYLPDDITVLRKLDVILWMEAGSRGLGDTRRR